MTVTYSAECSKSGLKTFVKLLRRWKGSIFKIIYKELIIFLAFYAFVSIIYRYALTENQQIIFEKFATYCERGLGFMPLTFALGFYVTTLIKRWWDIFCCLAWIDRSAITISSYVQGKDDRARLYRRTLMRYLNLSQVFVLRDLSPPVKKRFPTYGHIVSAGFLTEEELHNYSGIEKDYNRYWLPILWSYSLLNRAKTENYIENEYYLHKIIKEIMAYRQILLNLINYDWICIPLGYAQAVNIGVYGYFIGCLIGRQHFIASNRPDVRHFSLDAYVPFFTILQFFFLMGWLKAAQSILNPLGEDDDDFELNYILERNLEVGYMIVDEIYNPLLELKKGTLWTEAIPELPYTVASLGLMDNSLDRSQFNVKLSEKESQLVYSSSGGSFKKVSAKKSKVSSGSKSRKSLVSKEVNTGESQNAMKINTKKNIP